MSIFLNKVRMGISTRQSYVGATLLDNMVIDNTLKFYVTLFAGFNTFPFEFERQIFS